MRATVNYNRLVISIRQGQCFLRSTFYYTSDMTEARTLFQGPRLHTLCHIALFLHLSNIKPPNSVMFSVHTITCVSQVHLQTLRLSLLNWSGISLSAVFDKFQYFPDDVYEMVVNFTLCSDFCGPLKHFFYSILDAGYCCWLSLQLYLVQCELSLYFCQLQPRWR